MKKERMAILKMLEKGIITSEEAERLLGMFMSKNDGVSSIKEGLKDIASETGEMLGKTGVVVGNAAKSFGVAADKVLRSVGTDLKNYKDIVKEKYEEKKEEKKEKKKEEEQNSENAEKPFDYDEFNDTMAKALAEGMKQMEEHKKKQVFHAEFGKKELDCDEELGYENIASFVPQKNEELKSDENEQQSIDSELDAIFSLEGDEAIKMAIEMGLSQMKEKEEEPSEKSFDERVICDRVSPCCGNDDCSNAEPCCAGENICANETTCCGADDKECEKSIPCCWDKNDEKNASEEEDSDKEI